MSDMLSDEGYLQTKAKLADLERRVTAIEQRTDLSPSHLAEVRRSYHMMMKQYAKELKLYEQAHAIK